MLSRIAMGYFMNKENSTTNTMIDSPNSILTLKHIFGNNQLDITRYKLQFLKRRIERRMQIKEISDFNEYLHLLEIDSTELSYMFESLSINVTSFFRDAVVFNALRAMIVPKMLSNIENNEKITAWSAGCASGEEPYSIAILLNDISEIYKKIGISKKFTIRIKATDI